MGLLIASGGSIWEMGGPYLERWEPLLWVFPSTQARLPRLRVSPEDYTSNGTYLIT